MTTQILIFLDTASHTTFNQSVQLIQLTTGLINFSVSGVIIGDMEPSHQKMALTHGFTKIIQIQTPDNTIADINISASLILDWLKPVIPDLFIFPDSDYGRLLGASIAAQLDLPFYPSINTLQKMDEGFILTRQTFGNKVKQTIYQNNAPFFLSAKISSSSTVALFPSAEEIAVIKHPPVSIPENPIHIIRKFQHSATIPVEQARIIITGGRGLLDNPSSSPTELSGEALSKWKVKSGFDLLQTLAKQLNGTVAATRALVDSGYAPYEWQIGQTGKFVSPELYIACGVSGAIQHTIGMNNSRTIIAINKDSDAPIFKVANYGIVGDLYEIIPQLINRLG